MLMHQSLNSGIYQILNKINKRFYIGSAASFYERYHAHLSYLNSNEHHNKHLQRAWNKYGPDAFEFQILEITNNLIEREQFWIDWTNATINGYNIKKTANSNFGLKYSIETRAKMSAWQIGNVMPEETKNKISNSLKGRVISDDIRHNMAIGHRKLEKWPCIQGCYCRCIECKKTLNKDYVKYRENAKAKKNK